MVNTVKDDILADLTQKERGLKAQLREIRDLKKAIKAVGADDNAPLSSRSNARTHLTLKDMILSVLGERKNGAEALEIIELIREKYLRDVARTSLSPQLSRLKADKALFLSDKVWYLYENRPTEAAKTFSSGELKDLSERIQRSNSELQAHERQISRIAKLARDKTNQQSNSHSSSAPWMKNLYANKPKGEK